MVWVNLLEMAPLSLFVKEGLTENPDLLCPVHAENSQKNGQENGQKKYFYH